MSFVAQAEVVVKCCYFVSTHGLDGEVDSVTEAVVGSPISTRSLILEVTIDPMV